MHGLLIWLGLTSGSGRAYLWWSGVGSDIGELAIVGALLTAYRRHACHVHRCWRIGRHPVEGTPYVTCRHHHPDGALTHSRVLAAHRRSWESD